MPVRPWAAGLGPGSTVRFVLACAVGTVGVLVNRVLAVRAASAVPRAGASPRVNPTEWDSHCPVIQSSRSWAQQHRQGFPGPGRAVNEQHLLWIPSVAALRGGGGAFLVRVRREVRALPAARAAAIAASAAAGVAVSSRTTLAESCA